MNYKATAQLDHENNTLKWEVKLVKQRAPSTYIKKNRIYDVYPHSYTKQEILKYFDDDYLQSLSEWELRMLLRDCRVHGVKAMVAKVEYDVRVLFYG